MEEEKGKGISPRDGEDAGRAEFTVIISTFNEETTIGECLERLSTVCPQAEIMVIHGGRDRTAEIAREWSKEHSFPLRVLDNYGDSGKGHAIKLGISLARSPVMVQFDADLQFAPEDIPRVVAPVLQGAADLVIGSRFMEGVDKSGYQSSFLRDLGNSSLKIVISLLAGREISDVTTGLKAWSKKAIWDIEFKDNRFLYEMEIVLRAALKGYRIYQIPVRYRSRQGGFSGHGRGVREYFSIASTGLKIIYKAFLIRLGLW